MGTYLVDDCTAGIQIVPAGIKVVSVSVQNIIACKYIAPTGKEIVSVVVQIIPTGKNLPHMLQI